MNQRDLAEIKRRLNPEKRNPSLIRGCYVDHVGNLITTDVFYTEPKIYERWAAMGVLGVEMETTGLYVNAAKAGKRALSILTVSDNPLTGESTSAEERQTSFTQMMEIALDVACHA